MFVEVNNLSNHIKAIYITSGDPWHNSTGGKTAFAKQMLNAFSDSLAIVSTVNSSMNLPVGVWRCRKYNDVSIMHYNIGDYRSKNKSVLPIIPERILFRQCFKKHIDKILSINIGNIFCDSPELLDILARRHFNISSFCFRFAGLNNPISNSRYKLLRILGPYLFRKQIKNLKKISNDLTLIAAADNENIEMFKKKYHFIKNRIISFPTRVDTKIFHPIIRMDKIPSITKSVYNPKLICVGRLSWVKGWNLLLETILNLKTTFPNIFLTFVGDGEDKSKIIKRSRELDIEKSIRITGFVSSNEVCKLLNESDLCVVASYKEGWSVAMTEMLACGKVIVSTNVSGASTMIKNGLNGYVVNSRSVSDYSGAIIKALNLQLLENPVSLQLVEKYATKNLANEFSKIWNVFD